MTEITEQSANQYLRSKGTTEIPLIELNLTLKKSYVLASADITRLKFFSPSVAHIAFLVHNFEPMIDTLLIKLLQDELPEKSVPFITSVEGFYYWLNNIELFSNGAEFKYIQQAHNNYKAWKGKENRDIIL